MSIKGFFKDLLRPAERAVKKLLRDEPWLKQALRELAQDELLRLHEQVVAEINNRAGGYTTTDGKTIRIYGGDA